MRLLQITIACTLTFCLSCSDETVAEVPVEQTRDSDTLLQCCLASYELNENGDTINKVYGKRKQKHGHWVTYVLINGNDSTTVGRAKLEEGDYTVDKREGFWRQYNKDGSVRDSVEYRNDALIIPIK